MASPRVLPPTLYGPRDVHSNFNSALVDFSIRPGITLAVGSVLANSKAPLFISAGISPLIGLFNLNQSKANLDPGPPSPSSIGCNKGRPGLLGV